MANNSKINEDLKNQIIELHSSGLNPTAISKKLTVKLSKDTVKSCLIRNGLTPHIRHAAITADAYLKFMEEVKSTKGQKWSKICKKYDIAFEKAKRLLIENGIDFDTRADAAAHKKLSNEEALSRQADGTKFLNRENNVFTFMCPDGHVYSKTVEKLSQGCPYGKSGKTLSIDEIKERLSATNFELIESSYTKTRGNISAICKTCGTVRNSKYRLFFKWGCSVCNNTGTSQAESDVEAWVRSLGFSTEKKNLPNNKTKPKEIDVFIPQKNIGIEYCGLYWHCENSPHPRERSYHKDKMKAANSIGIRLITIFEDEWKERSNQVQGYLMSALGKNNKIIGARNCEVKNISPEICNIFMNNYHIQGSGRGSLLCIGLYCGEELVGAMSFSRHHRQNQEGIVLDRLGFKRGVSVHGGSSKMFDFAKPFIVKMNYHRVVSWSDNRWSEGAVYKAMGFTLEEEGDPDYSYVKGGKRHSKQSLKKTSSEKQLNKTEWELRQDQGYDRIWDCGKKRWAFYL